MAQPTIADFVPKIGAPGDQVYIYGTGFTSGPFSIFFWRGKQVIAGVLNSDTQVTVTIPAGATTGPLGLQSGTGPTNYTAENFTVIGAGPYISDFLPAFGAVNDLITINGAHLTNSPVVTPVVKFNGVASAAVTVNAAGTQVTARVPSGATNGPISVTTAYGTANSPTAFTVIGPGPYITSFAPFSATAGGVTVFLYGVQFLGATGATFNGQPGVNFAVQSETSIRVDTPTGVTTGPIAVNAPNGVSITASNFLVPPVITAVVPSAGRAGTNVTFTGGNFVGTTAVTFNNASAAFTVVNNTNLQATVPLDATTGLIRVITPAFSAFSPANFVVQPVVSGFSPNLGIIGTSVTVNGANFNVGIPAVRFNGVTAPAPTGVTFNQLTAVVPAGATTGPISVSTADGGYTNGNNFFLPPSIANFTPTNSAPGTRVTVTGQNFIGTTAVTFNGVPATSYNVTNNTTLGATVPAGVSTGPISVSAPAGTATSGGAFYAAPVIIDFAPRHGLPGDAVTLLGTNFLGATAVRFNGVNGSLSSVANGQIVARVPSGAQTGPITVVAPAGTSTSTANFALDYTSDLQVFVTNSPNPVSVGSNLVYYATIVNNGPFDAPNAQVTNTLPASVVLLNATVTTPWILATNGNQVTGRTTNFGFGATASLVLTVAPQSQGNILDVVTVASDNPDPVSANNTATVTTTVQPLALLSIRLLTNQVKVSWPVVLSNYVLESKNGLGSALFWSNVTTTPVVSGAQKSVTETNAGISQFYRLRQ